MKVTLRERNQGAKQDYTLTFIIKESVNANI